MVTTLYLIRHGETEDAHAKRYKGHIDVPLSENGIEQMERLSKYIAQNSSNRLNGLNCLTAVYTSDLSRAVKSAEVISQPHRLKPIIMPELRERNFGIWEGMTFDEIRGKYPMEFEAWASNPLKFSPMQGESTIEVRDRVINALNWILNEQKSSEFGSSRSNSSNGLNRLNGLNGLNNISIAIVSHGGVNRIILCHFLDIPLQNIFRVEQDYGALNVMEFHDDYPVVKLMNFTL